MIRLKDVLQRDWWKKSRRAGMPTAQGTTFSDVVRMHESIVICAGLQLGQ